VNNPTKGPWGIGKPFPGSTVPFREVEDESGRGLAVVQGGRHSDLPAEANANLIVAAVNACFAINPENPLAVAEALPELVEALRLSVSYMGKAEADGFCLECARPIGHAIEKVRAALAKIEAKP
jgi:hypothetical protein